MASVNQFPDFYLKKTLTGSKMDPVSDKIQAITHSNDNNYPNILDNLTHYLSFHCFFQNHIPELFRLRNNVVSPKNLLPQMHPSSSSIAKQWLKRQLASTWNQGRDSTGVN